MRVTAGSVPSNATDLYNSASGTWSTAQLSVARFDPFATSAGNVAIFAGGWVYSQHTATVPFNAVDLYNSASGTWSTAQLSVARWFLAATSIGSVAIFAGGFAGNCSLTLFGAGLLLGLMISVGDAVMFACLRRGACWLLCMRCRRMPSHEGHCRWWTFQCCGLVQQCIVVKY